LSKSKKKKLSIFFQKMPKSCQKVVKKLSKVVEKLSKNCQTIVKKFFTPNKNNGVQ
jgi:hypothetical protein